MLEIQAYGDEDSFACDIIFELTGLFSISFSQQVEATDVGALNLPSDAMTVDEIDALFKGSGDTSGAA